MAINTEAVVRSLAADAVEGGAPLDLNPAKLWVAVAFWRSYYTHDAAFQGNGLEAFEEQRRGRMTAGQIREANRMAKAAMRGLKSKTIS